MLGESGHVDGGTTTAIEDWCLDALKRHSGAGSELSGELSSLTVVVPSWQRQDYLLRQIRYWSASSASLVIVDGSRLPLPDRIRSAVEAHPRITYRHDLLSQADRLRLAGGLIKSPYAVMLGDDEFHLPAGLSASIRVLDYDQKLVGCMGHCRAATHCHKGLPASGYLDDPDRHLRAQLLFEQLIGFLLSRKEYARADSVQSL